MKYVIYNSIKYEMNGFGQSLETPTSSQFLNLKPCIKAVELPKFLRTSWAKIEM